MRPQVLLVAVAVLAVLVALPLGNAHEEEEGADATRKRWPCCDECGICTRSMPPICKCEDKSTSGCHPACKQCVMSWDSNAGAFVSQCNDMIVNFCKRRCTRRPADADDDA